MMAQPRFIRADRAVASPWTPEGWRDTAVRAGLHGTDLVHAADGRRRAARWLHRRAAPPAQAHHAVHQPGPAGEGGTKEAGLAAAPTGVAAAALARAADDRPCRTDG